LQYVDDAVDAPNRTGSPEISWVSSVTSGKHPNETPPKGVWVFGFFHNGGQYGHIGFLYNNGTNIHLDDTDLNADYSTANWPASINSPNTNLTYMGWTEVCDGRRIVEQIAGDTEDNTSTTTTEKCTPVIPTSEFVPTVLFHGQNSTVDQLKSLGTSIKEGKKGADLTISLGSGTPRLSPDSWTWKTSGEGNERQMIYVDYTDDTSSVVSDWSGMVTRVMKALSDKGVKKVHVIAVDKAASGVTKWLDTSTKTDGSDLEPLVGWFVSIGCEASVDLNGVSVDNTKLSVLNVFSDDDTVATTTEAQYLGTVMHAISAYTEAELAGITHAQLPSANDTLQELNPTTSIPYDGESNDTDAVSDSSSDSSSSSDSASTSEIEGDAYSEDDSYQYSCCDIGLTELEIATRDMQAIWDLQIKIDKDSSSDSSSGYDSSCETSETTSSDSTSTDSSSSSSSTYGTGTEDPNDTATVKALGKNYLKKLGMKDSEWEFVDYIITHESSWIWTAENASSGAYGLAQRNPSGGQGGFTYGSSFEDYKSNWHTQLEWFMNYCNQKYGGIAGAQAYWAANGNY